MLIDLVSLIEKYNLNITGILHVGASVCEELDAYKKCGLTNNDIFWIEGNENVIQIVKKTLDSDIKIYNYLIDEQDDIEVLFNISNFSMSSSLLEFGSHLHHHPGIYMVNKIKKTTTRLDTFIKQNQIPIEKVNFFNIDIQGTELRAIKSLGDYIDNIDYIVTEVNTEYVYKDCNLISEIDDFLNEKGFFRAETTMYGNCGWGDAFYIRKSIFDNNDYYQSSSFKNYKNVLKGEGLYFEKIN